MQRKLLCMAVLRQVIDDDETNTADNDQKTDNRNDNWVGGITAQRQKSRFTAKQIKACVAERGHRRKHCDKHALRSKFGYEHKHQNNGASSFDNGGRSDNKTQHTVYIGFRGGDRFLRQMHPAQSKLAPDHYIEKLCQRDKPKPADLNQQQDNHLSKRRPMLIGIIHN